LRVLEGYRDPVILALGATQTIGYGTLYYSYGVLAAPVSAAFGVSVETFFAIFTAGLLLGGLVAPLTGRLIDRHGARMVMVAGSVIAAAGLALAALAPNIVVFTIGVLVMEIAACMALYEAAFAGLAQIYRHEARARIAAITLIAGFASTIFWPLTQALQAELGWRATFGLFAAANLLVCVPLHWRALRAATPIGPRDPAAEAGAPDPPTLQGRERRRAIILYVVAVCVSGLVYASIPVHLVSIIAAEGFSAGNAALLSMVMGPAQIVARIIDIAFGHRFDALATGRVALAALVVAPLVLLATSASAASAVVFALTYGVSQGLITIARGAAPLLLFGVRGYATLVGRITGIRFFVNAGAPFAFALAVSRLGMDAALIGAVGAALCGYACFHALRAPGKADRPASIEG
jgi:MFS family permease